MDGNLITMIEVLRSQILEIHNALEHSLLSQTVRRTSSRFKLNETRKTMVRINITCLDAESQILAIEELSRILSLANSLKSSFDVLTAKKMTTEESDLV